jgi:FkbM family methyltransferase
MKINNCQNTSVNLNSSTFIGKLLRIPLRFIPKTAIMPICSGPLRSAKWIAGSSVHGCWLGLYERVKVDAFIKYLKPTSVVYDVGANVGYYSLIAGKYSTLGAVYSFEPLPSNVELLRRHLIINKINNVTIFDCAVSDKEGEAFFEVMSSNLMGRLALQGNLKVRMSSLDSIIQLNQAAEPDIIKMDIEGAEYDALCGAVNLLKRKKPTLFLATHGAVVHTACCQLLKGIGYDLSSVDNLPVEKTSEIIAI